MHANPHTTLWRLQTNAFETTIIYKLALSGVRQVRVILFIAPIPYRDCKTGATFKHILFSWKTHWRWLRWVQICQDAHNTQLYAANLQSHASMCLILSSFESGTFPAPSPSALVLSTSAPAQVRTKPSKLLWGLQLRRTASAAPCPPETPGFLPPSFDRCQIIPSRRTRIARKPSWPNWYSYLPSTSTVLPVQCLALRFWSLLAIRNIREKIY